ncbi:MAG: glycosyltransferase family 2 protein [Bacteroidia bacterium]|jgi:glycosyltransferase involved in cell wall biosynthesis
MLPLISICIPTYNQADKLKFLLDSIRVQTFRDFEVIVSDDSNCDDVALLCNSYSDLPISYYRNQPAKGTPENWNYAISLAKGTWIKLMHHDDYFSSEDSLKHFVEFAESNPMIDYVFCATKLHSLTNEESKISNYVVDKNVLKNIKKQSAYLFPKNIIGSPSIGLQRKSINISFDVNLIWLVDVDYFIQLLFNYKVVYLDKPLITTIISETQLSKSMSMNPDYELSELAYCYNKFAKKYNRFNRKIMRQRFIYFLNEFQLYRLNQIKLHTKNAKIPFFVKVYCILSSLSPKIANSLFYRLNYYQLICN